MPISYSESSHLTCPDCGKDFTADIWLILDAQEQPAEAEALRQGRLNVVTCPHCGSSGPAGAPLLYHDAATRQVLFASAPGAAEHEWREQARALHALLVGSIPVEERRSYLSDVQIAQDIDGIAHLLNKAARRGKKTEGSAPRAAPAPPPEPAQAAAPNPPAAEEETPPLLLAVQALLAADSPEELQTLIAAHPVLLADESDLALSELADVATEQREYEIAASRGKARQLLARLRAANDTGAADATATDPAILPASTLTGDLPDTAYQALLQVQTSEQLLELVQQDPLFLNPAVEGLLAQRIDQAIEDGNERLAQILDERREALAELRAQVERLHPPAPEESTGGAGLNMRPSDLEEALEALLTAEDEEMMAQVLDNYPVLLTDEAQDALWQFAAEARAGGDEEMAIYAVECRAMLRQVREGLEQ